MKRAQVHAVPTLRVPGAAPVRMGTSNAWKERREGTERQCVSGLRFASLLLLLALAGAVSGEPRAGADDPQASSSTPT